MKNRSFLAHVVRHFVSLHHRYLAEGRTHAGILVTNETYVGRLVARLLAFAPTVNPKDLNNRLRFL